MFYQYIPPHGLAALQHYKYTGTDLSILANTILKYYWNWVTEHIFPLWVAPNVITLMGLICLFLNFIVALYLCPVLPDCEPPRWLYLFVAINIFLYQTFDNVDGKQARRTSSSTALGELFDHGCDSLFLMLTAPAFFCAVRADINQIYSFLTIGFVAFFFSHWEEYHTNILILGKLGNPTEVQWALILVFLSSFFFGPDIWRLPLSAVLPQQFTSFLMSLRFLHSFFTYLTLPLEWKLNTNLLIFIWVGIIIAVITNIIVTYRWMWRNDRQNIWLKPIQRLAPHAIHISLVALWVYYSTINIVATQTAWLVTFHGFLFSYLVDQLMIARICKLEYPWWNHILWIPLIGVIHTFFSLKKIQLFIPEQYVLPLLTVVLLIFYWRFIISVILQLTTHLKIRTFVIPYPPPKMKNTNENNQKKEK